MTSNSALLTRRNIVLLGALQIVTWGGSFFLMSVLAGPLMHETGWSHERVMAAVSIALAVAAMASPACGRIIAAGRGRELIASSGPLIAVGLWIVAGTSHLGMFYLGWVVIGFGMAAGLYDSLFSTLGSVFGPSARGTITGVTLISGFASAIIWPLLAWAFSLWGWRLTCGVYGLLLIATAPLYLRALPRAPARTPLATAEISSAAAEMDRTTYVWMTISFAIAAGLMTAVSVALIELLQANGMSLASAIALSAVIGPAQVVFRIIDMLGRRRHPLTTALMASGATAAGLLLLAIAPAWAFVALVFYGAGNGMRAIVKSTLPLSFVRGEAYARVTSRMARPMFMAQALAPIVTGYLMGSAGAKGTAAVLCSLGLIAVGATVALKLRVRKNPGLMLAPAAT